jgi:hypothetical protein
MTTTPVRIAGKRGKRPAEPLAGLKFIHEYAVSPLPAPVYPVDVTHGIGADSWQMLANGPDPTCTVAPDGVGNCTFAGRQHLRMAKAAGYGESETWETSNELVEEYLTYDGGQDDGAVISALLLSWYRAGVILGFAPVDHRSPEAVDAAMQAFNGVYVGVNLTDDAEQLFGDGEPWTTANGEQPDPDDGHCIVGVKATASGRTYVTWGAEQEATADWSSACVTEVYVLITTEDEAAKVDMPALTADIETLRGHAPAVSREGTAMPEPTPETGPVSKLEEWAEEHLAPGLADIKAAVAGLEDRGDKALTWLEAHAANAKELAGLVVQVVKVIDPADASLAAGLVSKAEAVLAEAERIAEEVLGDSK